jgi:CheY-like chemotaxis protein
MCFPRHIIIADGDSAMRTLVRRTIFSNHTSVMVSTVDNGQKALAAYEHVGADLIITSHALPELDGVALTHAVRLGNPTTPIVMLTHDPSIEPQARQAGVTCLLETRDGIKQLPDIITQLLDQP